MSYFIFANVFKILHDHYRLPDGVDVLQLIMDDREQEQKAKEADKNNDNGNISFVIEMGNVKNDEIIKKKDQINQRKYLKTYLLSNKRLII